MAATVRVGAGSAQTVDPSAPRRSDGFYALRVPCPARPTRLLVDPSFAKRCRAALGGYTKRWRWFGALPSFQENADALDGIRRQLGCRDLTAGYPYEKRYPVLDRDLLEFLFAIPREQLVRPGERRSLMRRALKGIVPEEVSGSEEARQPNASDNGGDATRNPVGTEESPRDRRARDRAPQEIPRCARSAGQGKVRSGAFSVACCVRRRMAGCAPHKRATRWMSSSGSQASRIHPRYAVRANPRAEITFASKRNRSCQSQLLHRDGTKGSDL